MCWWNTQCLDNCAEMPMLDVTSWYGMVDKPQNNNNSGVRNSKDIRPIPHVGVAVGDRCVVGS